jgi:hypothetical protein
MLNWNLENGQVIRLGELIDRAVTAWETNSNPEIANRRTSVDKKHAFEDLKHFLSLFTSTFYMNSAITDADLEAMGLRPRRRPAARPTPEPDEAPEVSVVTGHHTVSVYVARTQHGVPVRSLNTKYYGFILRYRIGSGNERHQQMSTRLHVTLSFESGDEGKRLYFSVAWLNARLQHGPWSDELSTLIN